MSDYISQYFEPFGVKRFHDEGVFGRIRSGDLEDTKIKVYIIDSGFDDLDPLTPGIQVNLDLSEVIVRNFSNEAGSREKPSHGSMTAALMAAPLNNFGILGVCPEATVYLGDVDNADKKLYQTNVVNAINDAVATEVDIIVLPLGSTTFIPELEAAVQAAVEAGIYVFASAGNSGVARYEYPAAFPGVFSVGSVNLLKELSTFNTRNERVVLFAPGEQYYIFTNVGAVLATGTSFSAPFAAGLAALHLCKERETDPDYKPTRQELINVLRSEDYLDNGTLSYPVVPEDENGGGGFLDSEFGFVIPILGGFLVLSVALLAYLSFKERAQRKKMMAQ